MPAQTIDWSATPDDIPHVDPKVWMNDGKAGMSRALSLYLGEAPLYCVCHRAPAGACPRWGDGGTLAVYIDPVSAQETGRDVEHPFNARVLDAIGAENRRMRMVTIVRVPPGAGLNLVWMPSSLSVIEDPSVAADPGFVLESVPTFGE